MSWDHWTAADYGATAIGLPIIAVALYGCWRIICDDDANQKTDERRQRMNPMAIALPLILGGLLYAFLAFVVDGVNPKTGESHNGLGQETVMSGDGRSKTPGAFLYLVNALVSIGLIAGGVTIIMKSKDSEKK